ncbi:hypothetical protein BGLT_02291 [Caballeronia glathei]|uniref:GIY-YIG domain-containing protein n=1 Tax=Caballeronia glathei TaxID=60547 RepID=A0A069PW45_9BURK|nr:GIY-YIG nuclease family protein [Caballeronia glathei]KDR41576.1 hypothetical protein BG61_16580 [Caballeronia glathei]CDY79510.1 hypothetical protein BGLT_02291 [Caballeronia glathei]
MAIPLHTFEPTGDPIVDDFNFFRVGANDFSYDGWFTANAHVLLHTGEEIIRDAEPYTRGDGPNCWGIYVLISNNEIAYVGRAMRIYERLMAHQRSGKVFDRYWCVGGIPYDWLGSVEDHYVRRLKPYLNAMKTSGNIILERIAKKALSEAA